MLCWEAPIAIPGGTRAPGWDSRGRDTRAPVGSEVTTGCPSPGWAGLLGVPWMPAVWWTPLGVPSSSSPGGPRPGRRLLDSPALAATPPPPPPLGKPGRLLAPRLAFFQAHRAEGAAGLSGWQAFLEQQCHPAECFSARRPHPAPGGAGAGLAAQARWLGGPAEGLPPAHLLRVVPRSDPGGESGPAWAPLGPGGARVPRRLRGRGLGRRHVPWPGANAPWRGGLGAPGPGILVLGVGTRSTRLCVRGRVAPSAEPPQAPSCPTPPQASDPAKAESLGKGPAGLRACGPAGLRVSGSGAAFHSSAGAGQPQGRLLFGCLCRAPGTA